MIDEWTSEASAHELELEPGTYTLTEVQAPTGYTGAGSVTIKVDDDYNFSVSGEIDYSYKGGLLKIVIRNSCKRRFNTGFLQQCTQWKGSSQDRR